MLLKVSSQSGRDPRDQSSRNGRTNKKEDKDRRGEPTFYRQGRLVLLAGM